MKKKSIFEESRRKEDMFSVAWSYFTKECLEDPNIQKMVEKERTVLSNTIIYFSSAYIDKEINDLMIVCQDLISKLHSYLEFWT